MSAWLLLVLTIGSAYLTYDAFVFYGPLKRSRFIDVAASQGEALKHLPLHEQERIKQPFRSSPMGLGQLPWAFLVFTLGFAVATVVAFLE